MAKRILLTTICALLGETALTFCTGVAGLGVIRVIPELSLYVAVRYFIGIVCGLVIGFLSWKFEVKDFTSGMISFFAVSLGYFLSILTLWGTGNTATTVYYDAFEVQRIQGASSIPRLIITLVFAYIALRLARILQQGRVSTSTD
jgi:ribose/xylose/arabinose/galactoside ABC-type transport system permease subunit